jgi:hypothetical protein
LMPKVKNTTDSFDEVINHLFFDQLIGFWESDFQCKWSPKRNVELYLSR